MIRPNDQRHASAIGTKGPRLRGWAFGRPKGCPHASRATAAARFEIKQGVLFSGTQQARTLDLGWLLGLKTLISYFRSSEPRACQFHRLLRNLRIVIDD